MLVGVSDLVLSIQHVPQVVRRLPTDVRDRCEEVDSVPVVRRDCQGEVSPTASFGFLRFCRCLFRPKISSTSSIRFLVIPQPVVPASVPVYIPVGEDGGLENQVEVVIGHAHTF